MQRFLSPINFFLAKPLALSPLNESWALKLLPHGATASLTALPFLPSFDCSLFDRAAGVIVT
jgi:hypothetical protein